MAQDQQQLMKVFGSLLAAKGGEEEQGPDPQSEYYRQRERYEKRRMLGSIVAPIAGNFLGNLVAAPFREPVQDFLRTEQGRELYGQWRSHDLEKQNVEALTGDIEKYEGNALEYLTHKNLESMGQEIENLAGPDWRNKVELRGTFSEFITKAEALAQEELAQYTRARNYYANFPTQEEFLSNVQRYGPKSTNLGQAFFRKIKRLFRGQSYDDFVKESIGNIVGVNYDIFEQDLNERPSDQTSREWAMDTRPLREILAESAEIITPDKMHALAVEARDRYINTAAFNLEQLDVVNEQITLEEMGGMTQAYLQYMNGEKNNMMSDLMVRAIRNLDGLGTDSTINSPAQVYNEMYEMIEITPDNFKRPDLIDWMKGTEVGHELLHGKLIEENITDKEGNIVIEAGTVIPGVREAVWYQMHQLSPERFATINWDSMDEDGNLVPGSGLQALNETERTIYERNVDQMLGNIIDASRDVAAVVIGKQLDTGGLPDGFYGDPAQTRAYQLGLINEGLGLISNYYLERKPTEVSIRKLLPGWSGVRREVREGILTGVILPVDQIMQDLSQTAQNLQDDAGLDITDYGAITDRLIGGDPTGAADPTVDPTGVVDPAVDPTILNLSDFDSWRTYQDPQGARIYSQSFEELDARKDDDYSYAQGKGVISNQVWGAWVNNNTDATFMERTQALNETKGASENLIPGTKAFNYAGMPLSHAVKDWHRGDQVIKDAILKVGFDLNEQPFVTGKDGEQLFVRLVPQGAGWDNTHQMVQDATGSDYFMIQVGRKIDSTEEGVVPDVDDFRRMGGNSSTRPSSPPKPPEKVFVEIGASEAKELLRDNWRELPDYLQQHIAVQFGQGYLPLLEELSNKYKVDDSDLLNKLGSSYMHGKTLDYPGDSPEEREKNEIRFAMDVSIKSVGVPGRDKGEPGRKRLWGRHTPVMHTIGLEAYSELIGTDDETRLEFLNSLRPRNTEAFSLLSSAEASEASEVVPQQEQESLLREEVEQAPIISEAIPQEQESLLREEERVEGQIDEEGNIIGSPKGNFDNIWEISSEFEGTGYVKNVGTLEESNRAGLTLKTYKAIQTAKGEEEPTANDLEALSLNQVKEIIREEFYDKPGLDKLPDDLQGVVFDHGLMRGSSNAIKLLQRTLGLRGDQVDGLLGEQTLDILSGAYLPQIINSYRGARVQDLEDLIEANPEELEQFRGGWMRRARTYGG